MRMFSEISKALAEEGVNFSRVQYTVIDGKGGYFQNVKRIREFSTEKIVLAGRKGCVCVEGASLSLGKFFLGDLVVYGDIRTVSRVE
ncbi:MAG: YabP/YqfC family sporulation protein [Clostridia bacterium]|nr:YabP/YqfC family sporulation protein [Clostridia bacterium]